MDKGVRCPQIGALQPQQPGKPRVRHIRHIKRHRDLTTKRRCLHRHPYRHTHTHTQEGGRCTDTFTFHIHRHEASWAKGGHKGQGIQRAARRDGRPSGSPAEKGPELEAAVGHLWGRGTHHAAPQASEQGSEEPPHHSVPQMAPTWALRGLEQCRPEQRGTPGRLERCPPHLPAERNPRRRGQTGSRLSTGVRVLNPESRDWTKVSPSESGPPQVGPQNPWAPRD